MLTPSYSLEEARTRKTFLALMWAMSHPGRPYALPVGGLDAYRAIGETLLDLETSYYTPTFDLVTSFTYGGARPQPPDRAQYHFYPELLSTHLETVAQANAGTVLNPDRSATLVIGCELGSGRMFRLSGPGIQFHTDLKIDFIPDAFWELRHTVARYPLGWDVFFVGRGQVIGLPRSTTLEKV